MTAAKIPVLVCRYGGCNDRFFGKFKDSDGKWKKIPGGPFPEQFNTRAKALLFAQRWYVSEMAEREARFGSPAQISSWTEICDGFITSVRERLRGADSSREKAISTARLLKKSSVLGVRPIGEHDERLALTWLRKFATEPKSAKSAKPRHPYTVRNARNTLRDVYKWARQQGYFPQGRSLPTDGEEFEAELQYLLSTVERREVMCPLATVRAMVRCAKILKFRRLLIHVYVLTGLRPGELHGLQVQDLKTEGGIVHFEVYQQWLLGRGKAFRSKYGPTKSRWSKRRIPLHPELQPLLEKWLAEGWQQRVGRRPKPADPLFPNLQGKPFREAHSDEFVNDLVVAECPSEYNGISLSTYSLRHTFETLAQECHIDSDAQDRLMGHRPSSTRALAYQANQLPYLFAQISKLPSILTSNDSEADALNEATASTQPGHSSEHLNR